MYQSSFAELADQLYQTPANLVPSEQLFSTQNLIHSKLQNTLQADQVNKLEFIYINSRILQNHHKAFEV